MTGRPNDEPGLAAERYLVLKNSTNIVVMLLYVDLYYSITHVIDNDKTYNR